MKSTWNHVAVKLIGKACWSVYRQQDISDEESIQRLGPQHLFCEKIFQKEFYQKKSDKSRWNILIQEYVGKGKGVSRKKNASLKAIKNK